MKKIFFFTLILLILLGLGILGYLRWFGLSSNKAMVEEISNRDDEPNLEEMTPELMQKAIALYEQKKAAGVNLFSGPCLGKIDDNWVVKISRYPDITEEDFLPENECLDYIEGRVRNIIHMTPEGDIILDGPTEEYEQIMEE